MGRRRKGPWKRKGQTKDDHWYTTIGKQTVKVADGSHLTTQHLRNTFKYSPKAA